MGVLRFDRWCSLAVSGIRFKPDRKEIYEELYAHMEDQYEELTAAGFSEKEAEEVVAAAMGDPGETSRQLARIHRPFWGYALRAARVFIPPRTNPVAQMRRLSKLNLMSEMSARIAHAAGYSHSWTQKRNVDL